MKSSVIGAGGVGPVIAGNLTRTKEADVKVGDIDPPRLHEVAKSSPGATVLRLDAGEPSQVGRFISGSDVVINASHPRFNKLSRLESIFSRTTLRTKETTLES